MFITTVAYVFGYFARPDSAVYSGIHFVVPGDVNTYFAFIEQARQGNFLFENLYTSESQEALLFQPHWLVLGWIAKLFSASSLFVFHLGRILLLIPLGIIVYKIIAYFFSDLLHRKIAYLFVFFTSGLGVFFNPFLFDPNNLEEHPTDIWVPESITFSTAYQSPHLVLSLVLLLVALFCIMRALYEHSRKHAVWAGVAAAFLVLTHPFYGVTVATLFFVWAGFLMLRGRKFDLQFVKYGLIIAGITLPAVVYYWWLYGQSYVLAEWSRQNILPSPSLWMYLIGFGLLLPLAIYGAFKGKSDKKIWMLTLWVVAIFILVYLPFDFQRRLIESVHIPLALLAATAGVGLYQKARKRSWMLASGLAIFGIVFLPMTNEQLVLQDFLDYSTKKEYPYYIPQDDMAGFGWIKENVAEDQIVFSSFYSGNFIPAYSGRRVFVGHGPQTIFLQEKFDLMTTFFDEATEDVWRKEFLRSWDISYFFYGQNEKDEGDFIPADASYLIPVFVSGATAVYSVSL